MEEQALQTMHAIEHYAAPAEEAPQLNAAQAQAVAATEGFVRVIAGAGTGKTRVLVERFAYLVNELGILPGNILCVTFSNKATSEMRQRIRARVGNSTAGRIATFHSFCAGVLQEDSHAVGYPKNFLVLDDADIDAMLQVVYEERGLTLRHMTFSKARDMIEMEKCVSNPFYYKDLLSLPLEDLKQKYLQATSTKDIIFYGYLYQEKKCFGFDYNDLINVTLHIFHQHPHIALKWQQRLEYVMVDEYQDIDPLQLKLLKVLVAHHKNLFVVGDPDQTIYTWRGASVRFLLDFEEWFSPARTIVLDENYRSVAPVLAVANSLISKNKDRIQKVLHAHRNSAGPTVWHHAKSPEDEAQWVAEGMQALAAEGVHYRDMAVLYRAHFVSRPIEEALLAAKIPYTLYSGVPFFERREVKDALSYLRMVVLQDDLSFERVVNVPKRNMGKRRMAYLHEWANAHSCSLYEALRQTIDNDIFKGTQAREFVELVEKFSASQFAGRVSDTFSALLNESGYDRMLRTEGSQERLDNVAELKQSVYEFESTCGEELGVEDYLRQVALFTNADAVNEAQDKVKLMTIHAAKGLEFKHVFFCSVSEGVIPSRKTLTAQDMEEERRLAFVAITRAKDGLYLSEAEGFTHQGTPRYPSRFLLDIDPATLLFSHKVDDAVLDAARASYEAADRWLIREGEGSFAPGQRVRHATFGEGTVQEVDMQKRAYLVKFDSLDTSRLISFKAKLETA